MTACNTILKGDKRRLQCAGHLLAVWLEQRCLGIIYKVLDALIEQLVTLQKQLHVSSMIPSGSNLTLGMPHPNIPPDLKPILQHREGFIKEAHAASRQLTALPWPAQSLLSKQVLTGVQWARRWLSRRAGHCSCAPCAAESLQSKRGQARATVHSS